MVAKRRMPPAHNPGDGVGLGGKDIKAKEVHTLVRQGCARSQSARGPCTNVGGASIVLNKKRPGQLFSGSITHPKTKKALLPMRRGPR